MEQKTQPALVPGIRLQGATYVAINTTPEGRLYALQWLDQAQPPRRMDCDGMRAWCKSVGGEAPTPAEALQMHAVLGKRLPQTAIWTAEDYGPNPSAYAWYCYLSYGYVYYDFRSAELGGVVVRRLFLDSFDALLELAASVEVAA